MRSPCVVDDAPIWLGSDGIVYRSQGYNPVRISEHWLEAELMNKDLSDAWGMTYAEGGHVFYVLTVPGVDRTYCYDVAMGRWHLRQSGTSIEPARWAPNCIARFTGNNLAGVDSGRVGHLSIDHYTDFGQPIRREGRTPPIYPDGARARCSEIELEVELGVGIDTGQGSDPHVMLRWSDDGGVTWSNERQASIGRQGARINRATVKRLGQFRQRTFSVAISDPVRVALFGFRVELF